MPFDGRNESVKPSRHAWFIKLDHESVDVYRPQHVAVVYGNGARVDHVRQQSLSRNLIMKLL